MEPRQQKIMGFIALGALVIVVIGLFVYSVTDKAFGKITPPHGFGGSTAQVVLSDERVPGDQGASRFKYAFGEEESEVDKLMPAGTFPGSLKTGDAQTALEAHLKNGRNTVMKLNSNTNSASIRGDPYVDPSRNQWQIMGSSRAMDLAAGREGNVVRSGFEMKTDWGNIQ